MCLAIPGQVVEAFEQEGMKMARVRFGGIVRQACLEYVPEAVPGDFVLVHVGFAISRVDAEEAARTYAALEELDQLTELDAPDLSVIPRADAESPAGAEPVGLRAGESGPSEPSLSEAEGRPGITRGPEAS